LQHALSRRSITHMKVHHSYGNHVSRGRYSQNSSCDSIESMDLHMSDEVWTFIWVMKSWTLIWVMNEWCQVNWAARWLLRSFITHVVTMCRAVDILKSHLATPLTAENNCRADFGESKGRHSWLWRIQNGASKETLIGWLRLVGSLKL